MPLGQHRGDQPDDRGAIGGDPNNVGAATNLLVEPLERVVGSNLPPVRLGERGEGEDLLARLVEQRGRRAELLPEVLDHRGVLARTSAGEGWAKIERTGVATIGWALRATLVRSFLAKWVRQPASWRPPPPRRPRPGPGGRPR